MPNVTVYRDLSRTCVVLKVALGIYIVIGLVGLWSHWLQVDMLQQVPEGGRVDTSVAAANDLRQWYVGRLMLLGLIATAILFLRWTYLTNRNTELLTTAKRQHSPGWAVGWYFIPVVSFWKPYLARKETFRASNPAFTDNWQQTPVPQLVSLWWLTWVMWNVGAIYVSNISSRAETFEEILVASQLAMASDVLDVALGLVGVFLVGKLHEQQNEKHKLVATAAI